VKCRNLFAIGIVSSLLVTTACSPAAESQPVEQKEEKPTVKKVEEKILKPATDARGMMEEGPGKWAGKEDRGWQKELDQLPSGLRDEEIYARLLMLLAEDYRPALKKLEQFNPYLEPHLSSKPETATKQKLHIEILLDASGSMDGQVGGGQKMQLAKNTIRNFATTLPDNVSIAIRVYGHLGSSEEKDKQLSCQSTELIYPLSEYRPDQFTEALDRVKSTGFTPLAAGIRESGKDLPPAEAGTQNIVYVVSDGEETCGGDPVAEAGKLHLGKSKALVNVIGFDIDDQGQESLKRIAKAGGGNYTTVESGPELAKYWKNERSRLLYDWLGWRADNELEVIILAKEKKEELNKLLSSGVVLVAEQDHKSLFYAIMAREKEKLLEAVNYLAQKKKVKDVGVLQQKISSRYVTIDEYLQKRYRDFYELIERNQEQYAKNIQTEFEQKEDEKDADEN
jgi:Ca-activated chloride channel family protein